MGIRFYCPNGHKLNVKSFLAGKRGICPHCDARFRIPAESQIPKGAPKMRPMAEPTGHCRAAAVPLAAAGRACATAPAVEAAEPAAPAPLTTLRDPIAEAPEAVWYVRPPSGGQYGPARSDIMRRWIAEGRVSADSMVWREGWPDWRTAGPLFPALTEAVLVGPSAAASPPASRVEVNMTDHSATSPRPVANKKTTTRGRKSAAPVVLLGLTIVVLFVVLMVVIRGMN